MVAVTVVIDEESLRTLAGDRSYERGQAYFANGHVHTLAVEREGGVRGTVDGTKRYRVQLRLTSFGLDGRCNCPYGDQGEFCKHCVAVALAWLDSKPAGSEGESASDDTPSDDPSTDDSSSEGPSTDGPVQPMSDAMLHSFLTGQDPDWLTGQLIWAAESDPLLRARLEVAAGQPPEQAYRTEALRGRLVKVIGLEEVIEHYNVHVYFADVAEVIGSVADVLEAGFATQAKELAEFALELLAESADLVMGTDEDFDDVVAQAEEIHFDACTVTKPEPVALAETLAGYALDSVIYAFRTALPGYAPLLGETGLARYRELVGSDPELTERAASA